MKTMWFGWVLAATLGWSAVAGAQSPGAVQTRLEARKVERTADGRETLVPAEFARPGDVIEYTAVYRNTGGVAVENLQPTLPIPANTEFLAGSAHPANPQASVDGHDFAPMPLEHHVVREGRDVVVPVPLRDYRFLRWAPSRVEAGKSLAFTARVRVSGETSPPDDQGSGAPR